MRVTGRTKSASRHGRKSMPISKHKHQDKIPLNDQNLGTAVKSVCPIRKHSVQLSSLWTTYFRYQPVKNLFRGCWANWIGFRNHEAMKRQEFYCRLIDARRQDALTCQKPRYLEPFCFHSYLELNADMVRTTEAPECGKQSMLSCDESCGSSGFGRRTCILHNTVYGVTQ